MSKPQRRLIWLAGILIAVVVGSVFFGRYPQLGFSSPQLLAQDELAQRLVLHLRLPRVIAGLLLGAVLSSVGASFQMLFSNPLVEPGFLGVSQGAAFGAALVIVAFGASAWQIQAAAVVFGLLGLLLSYRIARRIRYGGWVLRLVLSGITVSALFSAGLGILKYTADPLSQLQDITFWLLGGLWSVQWQDVLSIAPLALIGLVVLFRMRWRLNVLALEDEVAFSLGTSPQKERALVLLAGVAAVAAVISISGLVGWVGLLVPHITRRLVGGNGRYVIPASMLLGAVFVMLCDDIARTVMAGEIPLGILTSLAGALLFLGLLISGKLQVQR